MWCAFLARLFRVMRCDTKIESCTPTFCKKNRPWCHHQTTDKRHFLIFLYRGSCISSQTMKTPSCDICGFRDGHQNLTMIRCLKCCLHVHKECCGMDSFTSTSFTCWACQAVGREFEVEERDASGQRKKILQEFRPTSCALCNYHEEIHCMHPLYDSEGPSGRQMCIDGKLAWVHTLCAFVLTKRSFLFGCSRDGSYDNADKNSDDKDDQRSINSELLNETHEGKEFGDNVPVHHFVYMGLKKDTNNDNTTIERLREFQKLRCSICGANDKPNGVFRICVQVSFFSFLLCKSCNFRSCYICLLNSWHSATPMTNMNGMNSKESIQIWPTTTVAQLHSMSGVHDGVDLIKTRLNGYTITLEICGRTVLSQCTVVCTVQM